MARINKFAERVSFKMLSKISVASRNVVSTFRDTVGELQASVESLYPGDTIGLNIQMIPEIQNAIRNYCEDLHAHLSHLDTNVLPDMAFKGTYAYEVTEFLKCVKECCGVMIDSLQFFNKQLDDAGRVLEERDSDIARTVSNQASEIKSVVRNQDTVTVGRPNENANFISDDGALAQVVGPVNPSVGSDTSKLGESSSIEEGSNSTTIAESESLIEESPEVLTLDGEAVIPVVESGSVLAVDTSVYHDNVAAGFQVTTGNTTYEVNDSEFDLLCAVVSAESDHTYDDSLAVITTVLNRCETSNWIASFGTSPITQITGKGQFSAYLNGRYKQYANGNAPIEIQTAVRDALNGVRNHQYLGFRSNGSSGFSSNKITASGNRYK